MTTFCEGCVEDDANNATWSVSGDDDDDDDDGDDDDDNATWSVSEAREGGGLGGLVPHNSMQR